MAKAKVNKEKKMAKTTLSKIKKPSRLRSIFSHQINVWIALVVVLAAGGAGVYYNRQSRASSVGSGCTNYTLNYGDSGTCVKYMQKTLDYLYSGYNTAADGQFGPNTKRLVMSFQQKVNNAYSNLNPLTVDGIVGPQTWRFICYPPGSDGYLVPSPSADPNSDYRMYFTYRHLDGCN